MRTIASILIALCFLFNFAKANHPPQNTLIVKTINYSSNLHWLNSGKEILIIAAPLNMSEDHIIPNTGMHYKAGAQFGEGTAIGNGFVVYKGKGSAITVTGLKVGHMYYFICYEADANGDFMIPGPPLTSFICASLGYRAQLAWKSTNGTTEGKISVERSTDSENWIRIEDAGEQPLTMPFEGANFYDKGRLDGYYSYRLKHEYSNNQTVISDPIKISSYTDEEVFNVSPPETYENKCFISSDIPTDLTITNSKGELVKKFTLEEKTAYSYLLKDVAPGIYNISGNNSRGVLNKTITIKEVK